LEATVFFYVRFRFDPVTLVLFWLWYCWFIWSMYCC